MNFSGVLRPFLVGGSHGAHSLCCCSHPDLGEISYWNSVCYVWNRVCYAGALFGRRDAKALAINIVGEIRVNPLSDYHLLVCYLVFTLFMIDRSNVAICDAVMTSS